MYNCGGTTMGGKMKIERGLATRLSKYKSVGA